MENQLILSCIIAVLFGVIAGFIISRALGRRAVQVEIDSAKEQGKAGASVELATLTERLRVYETERQNVAKESNELTAALQTARTENAALAERASRVPSLDGQINTLLAQQEFNRQEILSLSTHEATTLQSLQDATDRLGVAERTVASVESELTELRRTAAAQREESGRLNAEIQAAREHGASVRDNLQAENAARVNAEGETGRLAVELAEANKQRAVFQADSQRLPLLDDKARALQQALADAQQQMSDLRESSGRVHAELGAEREALVALHDALAQERLQRARADIDGSQLTSQLSESDKRRAVFESDAARIPSLEMKLRESEQQYGDARQLAADLREVSGRSSAELKAERDALTALRLEFQTERNQREQAEAQANRLTTLLAEANGSLASERSQTEEKLALLQEARESMSNQFKSLANDILEEKSKKFTEQNQSNIGQLLDPLRTKLHEFQGKVEEVYVQEGKDRTALAEQVRQLMELNQVLSQDAKNLTSALKGSNKTQGNWGELILERVLEASGLRKGHEYDVQESHMRDDGTRAQPDVVVHLPENRHLIVDAKVSLVAYEACVAAEDDSARAVAIKRHLDSVRLHMKGLSEKNYQTLYGLGSLDFVLMFIPIEPAFMVAITHDQGLYMEALNKNVLLVSPSTLLFVVRTVAHLWRQEAQSRNAQEIAKRGAELYDRLCAFVVDLDKVGDRLRMTQDSYTDARNKLFVNKGNVIRQAEMLKQLGVKPSKSIPPAIVELASTEADDDAGMVTLPAA